MGKLLPKNEEIFRQKAHIHGSLIETLTWNKIKKLCIGRKWYVGNKTKEVWWNVHDIHGQGIVEESEPCSDL